MKKYPGILLLSAAFFLSTFFVDSVFLCGRNRMYLIVLQKTWSLGTASLQNGVNESHFVPEKQPRKSTPVPIAKHIGKKYKK